ncbi:MAG: hypothetical protein WA771_01300 [Chthoniobacterales bacterium]
MKISTPFSKILFLTAFAIATTAVRAPAQSTHAPTLGPRPAQLGDDKIVQSNGTGSLRTFTPDRQVYFDAAESLIWENPNYKIRTPGSERSHTGFHRRPLALDPGTYIVSIPDIPWIPEFRVVVEAGRVTSVWLNDGDRPEFTTAKQQTPPLVRDAAGDPIGYAAR